MHCGTELLLKHSQRYFRLAQPVACVVARDQARSRLWRQQAHLHGRKGSVKSAALEAARSSIRGTGLESSELAPSRECRAVQSHKVCPEEAQELSWGAAQSAL